MTLSIWPARLISVALLGVAVPAAVAAHAIFGSNSLDLFVLVSLFGAPAAAVACWGTVSRRTMRFAQFGAFVLCVVGFFALAEGLVNTCLPVRGGWSSLALVLSAAFHWFWLMKFLLRFTEGRELAAAKMNELILKLSKNPNAYAALPPLGGWQRLMLAGWGLWAIFMWLAVDGSARWGWDGGDLSRFCLLAFVVPPLGGLVGLWVAHGFRSAPARNPLQAPK